PASPTTFGAVPHWYYIGDRVQHDLNLVAAEQKTWAGVKPQVVFEAELADDERVRQELTIDQVRRRLRGNREPFNFYKEHDIARETLGFEFGKFLPMIRPGKDGVQKHFVVGVTVVAKDNNVERRDGPATGRFKQAPLLFLVVSGAELLGEIYKDEEEIR